MGCTQDHQLIANCFDFVDTNTRVSVDNLSLNLLCYSPTFYHFRFNKLKMAQDQELTDHQNRSPSVSKHMSEKKGKDNSDYASLVLDQDDIEGGSQSITSNIQHLMSAKISISPRDFHL